MNTGRSITIPHIGEDPFETQSTKKCEFSHSKIFSYSLITGTMNGRNISMINAQINFPNKIEDVSKLMWRRAAMRSTGN